MHDLIIVGAGPAGITAAIYAARKKIRTLVIAGAVGGKPALDALVENYPGLRSIPGAEFAAKLEEHLRSFDVEVRDGEEAAEIAAKGAGFIVRTNGGSYESKAVIVATGS